MKHLVFRALALLLASAPLLGASPEAPKGNLVLIGGGKRPASVTAKFIELAGGPTARILVVPTASELPDTVEVYRKELASFGASNVAGLDVRNRFDAQRKALVEEVGKAGGIFFAGGDQRRIVVALGDTPVGKAIEEAYRRGAVVGGTSAGTACMSPVMMTGEGDFKVISSKNVELSPGLGLFPGTILDQHFVARQRQNRLMSVVLEYPRFLGIGIDEATAVWLRPDGTFQVLGESSVVVYDAAATTVTRAPGDGPVLLGARNLRTHVLIPGDVFDVAVRSVVPPPVPESPATAPATPAPPVPPAAATVPGPTP
ncbi:MAG: cyanophycinase [Holophagales bacterium]|nr:cyanophycinase [Holophagales bacterium]